jgi:hypothetical protein
MQHSHKRGHDSGRIEGTWKTCKNQVQKNLDMINTLKFANAQNLNK